MTPFEAFLKKYNVTTCHLAKLAGMSKSQVSEYRRDIHRPSKQSVRRIAFALRLPLDSVLCQIPSRETSQNHPKPPIFCIACNRKLYKVPQPGMFYEKAA